MSRLPPLNPAQATAPPPPPPSTTTPSHPAHPPSGTIDGDKKEETEPTSQLINSKARQRRRQRLLSQSPSLSNRDDSLDEFGSQVNKAFEPDIQPPKRSLDNIDPAAAMRPLGASETAIPATAAAAALPPLGATASASRQVRRVRRRMNKVPEEDSEPLAAADTPAGGDVPKMRKKSRVVQPTTATAAILAGLEEDVIEMDDKLLPPSGDGTGGPAEDTTTNTTTTVVNPSVPTDKFYLEMEKKFTIQNKSSYEKKQEERMRQFADAELKRQLKEELKFQISTPRTALKTHKFLRALFLLIHGLNIGFLVWQAVVAYSLNLNSFTLELNSTSIPSQLPYFYLYQDLTMPIHCLSYFFLTICIIDCMDRVDLSKMSLSYFVKCISFQNQFWSIIFYTVAILASLSIVFIDEAVYISLFLDNSDPFDRVNANILNNVDTNVQVVKGISVGKAGFSLFAWLLFCIFVSADKTYESLEKRDFNLLDEIALEKQKDETKQPLAVQQQPPLNMVKDDKPIAINMTQKF